MRLERCLRVKRVPNTFQPSRDPSTGWPCHSASGAIMYYTFCYIEMCSGMIALPSPAMPHACGCNCAGGQPGLPNAGKTPPYTGSFSKIMVNIKRYFRLDNRRYTHVMQHPCLMGDAMPCDCAVRSGASRTGWPQN